MKITAPKGTINVCDFGGNARSGKGTIVKYLASVHQGIACDETGADYRLLTKALLLDGVLQVQMQPAEVVKKVQSLSTGTLASFVARREEILAAHGFKSLYQHEVNTLVPYVGQVATVRQGVRSGFQRRIRAVRDSGKYGLLLIDGRHLAPVAEAVKGVRVILRTFVSCDPVEAARRECLRDGIALDSPQATEVLTAIRRRNKADAERQLDPVRPDDDALLYQESATKPLTRPQRQVKAYELGQKAARTGRQVHLVTTQLPIEAMKEAAEYIVSGALEAAGA